MAHSYNSEDMPVQTSQSHPLRIAEVSAGPNCGLIGITFAPGKKQKSAFSGLWDRSLLAANLGDDADTTAAVAGQLAGALYGSSDIPSDWLAKLAWRTKIEARADELFEKAL